MTKPLCIIPARMDSSRFPGKPLAPMLGMALVLHVYERCRLYDGFGEVAVATCDQEIFDVVTAHGGHAVMTANTHERCTDRVQEAVENGFPSIESDAIIVMVQGDEVLVSPKLIAGVVDAQTRTGADVVNLGSRLYCDADFADPNTVKLLTAPDGRVLCFSRASIPARSRKADAPAYQQTGIMAFTWRFLKTFSALAPTPLEIIESVDMMRVLEHGLQIYAEISETETLGVDTPADLKRGEKILASDPLTNQYLDKIIG